MKLFVPYICIYIYSRVLFRACFIFRHVLLYQSFFVICLVCTLVLICTSFEDSEWFWIKMHLFVLCSPEHPLSRAHGRSNLGDRQYGDGVAVSRYLSKFLFCSFVYLNQKIRI